MNERQTTLMGYFATIAFDPKVRAARTFSAFKTAVYSCVAEDFSVVGAQLFENFMRSQVRRVEPIAQEFVGKVFNEAESVVTDFVGSFMGRRGSKRR